jgi:hypothetical protein
VFTEILKIKPVLDTAATAQMEQSLSARFSRVAQRFGQGLRSVIKGSFIGISLGLISRLLNPIEALEDKIKKLIGEGTDIRDLADRFNTSPGKLKQLQDVAQTLGVNPEQFKDMITKYAQAIEKGREELQNPFVQPSSTTLAVKQFVGEKDIAKSFTEFLMSLKASGIGAGTDLPLSERAIKRFNDLAIKGEKLSDAERQDFLSKGEIRKRTGMETRQAFEKEVFGEAQTGPARRLIEANVPEVAKRVHEPTVDKLNEAVDKAAKLADQKRALDVQNQTSDFVNATNKMTGKMVTDMAAAEKLQMDRETKQLDSYDDLRKAANGLEEVKGLLIQVSNIATKGLGYLGEFSTFIQGLKNSRMFRGLFGSSGKGD